MLLVMGHLSSVLQHRESPAHAVSLGEPGGFSLLPAGLQDPEGWWALCFVQLWQEHNPITHSTMEPQLAPPSTAKAEGGSSSLCTPHSPVPALPLCLQLLLPTANDLHQGCQAVPVECKQKNPEPLITEELASRQLVFSANE